MTTYELCLIEGVSTYPLQSRRSADESRYDLYERLGDMLTDHDITLTADGARVVACDGEYRFIVLRVDWLGG